MEEKSVDELRTLNNQKSAADAGPRRTGDEHQEEGHIGIVEKRAWIGTLNWDPTGFHDHRRPEEPDRPVRARGATSRPDNSVEYAV
jgi:hypothetical protein